MAAYCFWFPGDYLRDTIHLGWYEDLAYRRLLDLYYSRGKPIPNDRAYIMRAVRANEPEQQSSVDAILTEYFQLKPDGWHQAKADRELERLEETRERQRNAAKARWNKNKDVADAMALQRHSHGNANPAQPSPALKEENKPSACRPRAKRDDQVPFQKIVDLYHQKLPMLPKVYALTEARKAQIRARWHDGSCPDLEAWEAFFGIVANSKFLIGEAPPSNGRKPFRADLEWLVRESNFVKILEGRYHHA